MPTLDLGLESSSNTQVQSDARLAKGRLEVEGRFFTLDAQRLRLQGVTYGPFAPNGDGHQFPERAAMADDFGRMLDIGINAIRVYHVPPASLLEQADEHGIGVFVDVPWPKHLCFLDSKAAQQHARDAVRQAATQGQRHGSVLAYSIGNEIPPDLLRWHGPARVERFLAELADVARQADPRGLVTYASYPPTEFLQLPFLDFVTFNVYLHDREAFRRYLFRLQNIIGDRPLVLGELGMDTLRHGEEEQAAFLAGHSCEARLMGLAGMFVFAWTDDWHTGGHPITDWAFGITRADRSPKASYHALREVFEQSPAGFLSKPPRVSIVVCSYNGGRTLTQCLRSLGALDYPDYEVIVVDDGSTDDTRAILLQFPDVRAIHQPNRGLSVARNVGLQAATGEIIAYTDSDCFADADWLTHLVYQLQRSGADAVGGPNLTPEDGWLAACVAASPGQPTHVLESDQIAEHIPGCNMAFRRAALLTINGFDPQYRKAGDDVDLCWRLQQAGKWITFAPAAFVWHHRRQGPRAYLKQQAGYGEAESLLYFKHPDKFNHRGEGIWRGVLYGDALRGLCFGDAIIYRGTFATGFFQCIYQPGPAHWAMFPSTLEWHIFALIIAIAGVFQPWILMVAAAMLAMSALVACLQAAQARLPAPYDGFVSRVVVAGLCYLQPLVRSWARYRTRLLSSQPADHDPTLHEGPTARFCAPGTLSVNYWTEQGHERTELLALVIAYLNEYRWQKVIDAGWTDWDLQVYNDRWTLVEVCTTQQNHGGNKRLIRVRYRLRTRSSFWLAGGAGVLGAALCLPIDEYIAGGVLAATPVGLAALWWRGCALAGRLGKVFDKMASSLNLHRCQPGVVHGE
jgi:GT2 family glycosyltransferase